MGFAIAFDRAEQDLGKEVPPALKFNHLNNAFQTPITVSRVKRARTEAMSPARSPGPSPTKARVQAAPRSWPVAEVFEEPVEGVMDVQWFPGLEGDEVMPLEEVEEVDHKAEVRLHTP